MKKAVIGIDVGGTNTRVGIVDEEGNVLKKNYLLTPSHGNINLFISELATSIREIIHPVSKEIEILGIGIGAPNGNYYSGTIEYAPNLSFRGVIHIVELLKK